MADSTSVSVSGNFEDDDFCIRVRACGYSIYVCNDVFIHHFGSRSFAANNVDYTKTMETNWRKFTEKWGYPQTFPANGYIGRDAYTRGFDRRKHFVQIQPSAHEPDTRTQDVSQADARAPGKRSRRVLCSGRR